MLKIKYYRKLKGLTLEELAKMVGVTDGTISNYERGTRKPSYEMLLKLSEALDTDVAHLLGTASEEDDLSEYLEELRTRPEMKMLFDSSRHMSMAQVKAIVAMIEGFKNDSMQ